jgi:hypothetical protein
MKPLLRAASHLGLLGSRDLLDGGRGKGEPPVAPTNVLLERRSDREGTLLETR